MISFVKIQINKRQLIELYTRQLVIPEHLKERFFKKLFLLDNIRLLKEVRKTTPDLFVDYNVKDFYFIKYPILK
jgi:hypothetical protein